MKKTIALATLILSFNTFAGVFSSLKLEKDFDEYGRAEWQILKEKTGAKNWKKIAKDMIKDHEGEDSSCGKAYVEINANGVLDNLEREFKEGYVAAKLRPLVKKGLIIQAIQAADGSDGMSEYCSQTSMRFYAKDGEVLSIFFDYNT